MKIINRSRFPDGVVKYALKRGFKGVNDTAVIVDVVDSTKNFYAGTAYTRGSVPEYHERRVWSKGRHKGYIYLVQLRVPPPMKGLGWRTSAVKRMNMLYPDGLFFESELDALINLTAHEAKHIFQFQRMGKRKRGVNETECERHGAKILNDYRVETNRVPLPPCKLPNPFDHSQPHAALWYKDFMTLRFEDETVVAALPPRFPLPSMVSEEVRKLRKEYLLRGISASEINTGDCRHFAQELQRRVGGEVRGYHHEATVEYGGVKQRMTGYHCYLYVNDLYFDSECAKGSKRWSDLPIFQRGIALIKSHGFDLEAQVV